MNRVPPSRILQECKRLEVERRYADALDFLDECSTTDSDGEPLIWIWKGSLLLKLGRHQEAEQTLRAALARPEWPNGHPGIARWLAEVHYMCGRFNDVEQTTAQWAARGDLECAALRFRALLALGRAEEVFPSLIRLAEAARGHVGLQLVLLEATLDLRSTRKYEDHSEVSAQCVQRLTNMRRAGVDFHEDENSRFEALLRRIDGNFGFRRR